MLNFNVKLSEVAKADGSTTMTLSNGARVTLSVGDKDSQFLTGQYEVRAIQMHLPIIRSSSIPAGTIVDMNDQGLTEQSAFNDLGGIIIDANAPNGKLLGTDDDPHTYDPSKGQLTLKGSGLGTSNGSSRDVVDIVDWSKLTWNVDGFGSTTLTFSSLVESALVNSTGTNMVVQLNEAGIDALHSLTNFGGVETSGGPRMLNVSTGFLQDFAGNNTSAALPLSQKSILQIRPRQF